MTLVWIAIGLAAALAVWLGYFSLLSYLVRTSERQRQFETADGLPQPPDGFYKGTAHLLGGGPVPWLGKSFVRTEELGFNIFTPAGASMLKVLTPLYKLFEVNADGTTRAFNFRTSRGTGLKDTAIQVIKLDYDSPENPFLIRIILDEIVQTAPGEYLGKVHMKVFPGYFATIGFFGLRK